MSAEGVRELIDLRERPGLPNDSARGRMPVEIRIKQECVPAAEHNERCEEQAEQRDEQEPRGASNVRIAWLALHRAHLRRWQCVLGSTVGRRGKINFVHCATLSMISVARGCSSSALNRQHTSGGRLKDKTAPIEGFQQARCAAGSSGSALGLASVGLGANETSC